MLRKQKTYYIICYLLGIITALGFVISFFSVYQKNESSFRKQLINGHIYGKIDYKKSFFNPLNKSMSLYGVHFITKENINNSIEKLQIKLKDKNGIYIKIDNLKLSLIETSRYLYKKDLSQIYNFDLYKNSLNQPIILLLYSGFRNISGNFYIKIENEKDKSIINIRTSIKSMGDFNLTLISEQIKKDLLNKLEPIEVLKKELPELKILSASLEFLDNGIVKRIKTAIDITNFKMPDSKTITNIDKTKQKTISDFLNKNGTTAKMSNDIAQELTMFLNEPKQINLNIYFKTPTSLKNIKINNFEDLATILSKNNVVIKNKNKKSLIERIESFLSL